MTVCCTAILRDAAFQRASGLHESAWAAPAGLPSKCPFCALRSAARGACGSKEGIFSLHVPATYSSARARLGNVAGYYQPSLAGLVRGCFGQDGPPLGVKLKDLAVRADLSPRAKPSTRGAYPAPATHLLALAEVSRKATTADTNSAFFSTLGICPHLSNATKRAPGIPAAYFSPEEKGTI